MEWFAKRGRTIRKDDQFVYVFTKKEMYIARHIKKAKLWVLEHEKDIHKRD